MGLGPSGDLLEYGGLHEGNAVAMVSSEGLENRLTSSGRSGAVVAWVSGRVVAVWVYGGVWWSM